MAKSETGGAAGSRIARSPLDRLAWQAEVQTNTTDDRPAFAAAIAGVLAVLVDKASGTATAGYGKLGRRAGCKRTSVWEALNWLEVQGYIKRKTGGQTAGGGLLANEYELLLK